MRLLFARLIFSKLYFVALIFINLVKNEELELPSFFQMTPDLVCIAGKDGFFKKMNVAVIQKLGFTEAELLSQPISGFIHPDDRVQTALERKALLNGKPLINFQNRYITKGNNIIWLDWTSIYFEDREIVFAIAKDITLRKQAEKEIEGKYRKFKSLATHFKNSIEKDRKFLAVELHEELAQLAAVVKMDIDWVMDKEKNVRSVSVEKLEHASSVLKLLIKSIQRISFSISPDMLDKIGLEESLEWLCKEFSILNGTPCQFKNSYNESIIPQELKIDFFRFCQESLNSVMYEGGADKITISIEDKGDMIALIIYNEGEGREIHQHEFPGYIAMQERANSINGYLDIKKESESTTVSMLVAK